jgi:hypothetical protein
MTNLETSQVSQFVPATKNLLATRRYNELCSTIFLPFWRIHRTSTGHNLKYLSWVSSPLVGSGRFTLHI